MNAACVIDPEAETAGSILVVEDEILIRLHISGELRKSGFNVFEAVNADEAMAILTASHNVSVVVTDIRMPGSLDGFALAGWVRKEMPHIRVVIVTADPPTSAMTEMVNVVLRKPANIPALVGHLKNLTGAASDNHRSRNGE